MHAAARRLCTAVLVAAVALGAGTGRATAQEALFTGWTVAPKVYFQSPSGNLYDPAKGLLLITQTSNPSALHFDLPTVGADYIKFDAVEPRRFSRAAVSSHRTEFHTYAVEYCDAASCWDNDLDASWQSTGASVTSAAGAWDPDATGAHRYWRLRLTADGFPSPGGPWVFNIRFFETPCTADVPEAPLLGATSIDGGGNLVMAFYSDPRLESVAWNFVGGAGCDNDGTNPNNGWGHSAGGTGCASTHTLTKPLTAALGECGFSDPQDGGAVWYYEATIDVAAQKSQDPVFGTAAGRTDVTSFRVRVEVPKTAETASSDVTAFGEQITQAAVTLQQVELGTNAFTWKLDTSVQYPYELEATVTTSTGNTFESGPAVTTDSGCAGDADGCVQTHTITAAETDACSLTDVTLETTFTIKCRTDAVECSLPQGRETSASFEVNTDRFCAEVVEVAAVEPSLVTYSDSAGGTAAADFVVQSTVHARLSVKIEAGLRVDKVELTAVDIDTLDTSDQSLGVTKPFADLTGAANDYSWLWDGAGGQASQAHTDFSFLLNTNSLNFENNAPVGQVGVRLTAWATVHYTAALGQTGKRAYKVTSAGAQTASASAKFSTSASSSSGTSSSNATSSVFGVSAGVAVAAVVGVIAVLGVAAGAAVAAKKRRTLASAQEVPAHSSSSIQLDLAPAQAAAPAGSAAVNTTDLREVRVGYAAV